MADNNKNLENLIDRDRLAVFFDTWMHNPNVKAAFKGEKGDWESLTLAQKQDFADFVMSQLTASKSTCESIVDELV